MNKQGVDGSQVFHHVLCPLSHVLSAYVPMCLMCEFEKERERERGTMHLEQHE